jgi:hypothetical protein
MNYCPFPGCSRIADKSGMCIGHRRYAESFPVAIIKEQIKSINKVSDKRKELNKELAKVVKRIKSERPYCEIRAEGCSHKTECVHHKAGRIGTKLLDESYMVASCSNCNLWCETNDAEARDRGFKLSQHKQ